MKPHNYAVVSSYVYPVKDKANIHLTHEILVETPISETNQLDPGIIGRKYLTPLLDVNADRALSITYASLCSLGYRHLVDDKSAKVIFFEGCKIWNLEGVIPTC